MLSKAIVFIGFFAVSLMAFADQRFLVLDGAGQPVADAMILSSEPAPAPSAQPQVMDQINKTFVPHVLAVAIGQAVEFPNSDDIRHHVYSFSEAKPFEIKLYKDRPGDPVVFDQPGVVVLGCNIHDAMVGYIVVNDTAWAQTDASGTATLSLQANIAQVRVWHPRLSVNADRVETVSINPADSVQRITLNLQPPEAKATGFANDRFKQYAR